MIRAKLILLMGLALAQSAIAAPISYGAPADGPSQATPPQVAPATSDQASPLSKAVAKGWASRCLSQSRTGPLECSIQQAVVLPNSFQTVLSVQIQTASAGAAPLLVLQLPFGILLTGEASIQLDAHEPHAMRIQTCEAQGCFAQLSLTAATLNELQTSKRMTVSFENVSKHQVSIPVELSNFTEVFSKIQ